jgi:hypothetical protein
MFKPLQIILLIILCFLQTKASAQLKPFKLEGSLWGVDSGAIAIYIIGKDDAQFQIVEKKVSINAGKFRFLGKIPYPFKAYFMINDSIPTNEFFIDTGKQKTILNIDSLGNSIVITGSKSNDEYLNNYLIKIKPFYEKRDKWYVSYWSLLDKFDQKLPANLEDSMTTVYRNIGLNIDSVSFVYAKEHPKSYVIFWELYNNAFTKGYKLN